MAGLKDTQQSNKRRTVKPFGPSALVAGGIDAERVAEAVARAAAGVSPSDAAPRFPSYRKGKHSPGASGTPIFDPETGEVRPMVEGQDYITSRAALPDFVASAPRIPGAELFDVQEVDGVRIVRPTEPVTHGALAMAVERFMESTLRMVDDATARREGYHGLIPDPRNAAHVQAVWNLVRGKRAEPTPRTKVERRDGIPVTVAFDDGGLR